MSLEKTNGPATTRVNIISNLCYRDCAAAVEWLTKAFGFEQRQIFRDDKAQIVHAELTFGNGMVMIGPLADTPFGKFMTHPDAIGGRESQCCYVIVDDADLHFKRSKAAGALIIYEPETKGYGGRDYACRDPEGHLWSFGTYDPWAAVK